jgi:hypothetical protein
MRFSIFILDSFVGRCSVFSACPAPLLNTLGWCLNRTWDQGQAQQDPASISYLACAHKCGHPWLSPAVVAWI